MNIKILKEAPLSGLYDEVQINANEKSTFVIFEDSDYANFCGVFGGGLTKYSNVTMSGNIAFIVSFGQGYIFDIKKKKVLLITTNDDLQYQVFTDYKGYFLCNDNDELFIYTDKLIWHSGCISADGIVIKNIKGKIVEGKVNAFTEWEDFTLDLSSFNYNCKWTCELNYD